MKLSIVIPVYKVEEYLAACLDSILAQGFATDECEIIVINDGSPDNSKAIAESYAAKHQSIIFIDQENQGVSVARNAGLDIAKGEYIAFIDPDDSIYPDSLKPILARADQENIDILYLHLDHYSEKTGEFMSQMAPCGEEGVVKDGFSHPRRTYPATLYRYSVIGELRFKKGILRGQDTVFNCIVQSMAKRCSYCTIPYYKYLDRETSSRQVVGTEKNFISCLLAIETLHEFQKEHFPNPTTLQKNYFDAVILIFIRRTLEWIVLPQSNKSSFDRLKAKLRDMGLGYTIAITAKDFPMFAGPFPIFIGYRRLSGYWNALMHKFAKNKNV